jgi:hypothetical protein
VGAKVFDIADKCSGDRPLTKGLRKGGDTHFDCKPLDGTEYQIKRPGNVLTTEPHLLETFRMLHRQPVSIGVKSYSVREDARIDDDMAPGCNFFLP